MVLNCMDPFRSDGEFVEDAGGADNRMNIAKFTTSEEVFDADPKDVRMVPMFVESSGVGL